MSQETQRTTLTSLPPIIEDTEMCDVTENGHTVESELQSTKEQPPTSTSVIMSQSTVEVRSESDQSIKPVVMDVKRKKQAELELTKFVQSRLASGQQQNLNDMQEIQQVKKERESESAKTQNEEEADVEVEDKNISENEPIVRTDVIREADTDDKDEYPEEGLAKNLLSKFQTLATEANITKVKEHRPSGIASKPTGTLIVRARGEADASHFVDADEDNDVSGGVFESQPIVRTDVVKEDDRNDEEELPPAGLTKTLLSAFKEIGSSGENTPLKQHSRTGSGVGNRISDLLLRASEQRDSSSENEPVVRENVVRESDSTTDVEELPVQGTTKGLLSMFSQVSESAEKMKEKLHKPSGVARKRWSSKTKKTEETEGSEVAREIVKETTDVVIEEELPKSGQAVGLLKKFKSMESTDEGSGYQLAWSADKKSKGKMKEDIKSDRKNTDEVGAEVKADIGVEADDTDKQVETHIFTEDDSKSGAENVQLQSRSSTKVVSKFLVKDSKVTKPASDNLSNASKK